MISRWINIGFLLTGSLCACFTALPTHAGTPLDAKVQGFAVDQASVVEALRVLRGSVHGDFVLFGLEVAPYQSEPKRNLTFEIDRGTVRDVLQEIVMRDPHYTYEVVDEHLINVFPLGAKEDPKNLLNVMIKNFQITEIGCDRLIRYLDSHVRELNSAIMERSRVAGQLGWGRASSQVYGIGIPKVSLSASNLTVRELLNRIAQETEQLQGQEHGPTGWIYTFRVDESVPLGGHPRWDLF